MLKAEPRQRDASVLWVWLADHGSALHAVAFACILLVGVVLRFSYLGGRPFRFDEAVLYWIAQGDLLAILSLNAHWNSGPPLFAYLVAAASRVDQSEAFVRSVPAIFGVLTVGAVYWAARAFSSPRWALVPMLLAAVAPPAVDISQYLREYSLSMLMSALLVGAAVRYIMHRRLSDGLLTVVIGAVSLHVQYGLALLFAAVGLVWAGWSLVWLLRGPFPTRTVWLLGLLGVTGLVSAWLTWLLALHAQYASDGFGSGHYLASYYLEYGWRDAPRFLVSRISRLLATPFHAYEAPLLSSLISTMIVAAGLVLGLLHSAARPLTILVLVAIAVTAAAALSQKYPLGPIRQDYFLVSLLFIVAPLVASYLHRTLRPLATSVALGVVSVLVGLQVIILVGRSIEIVTFQGLEDMPSVLRALEREQARTDVLIFDPVAVPLYAYYTDPRRPPEAGLAAIASEDTRARHADMLAASLQGSGTVLILAVEWSWSGEQLARMMPPARTLELVAEGGWVRLHRSTVRA